MYELPFELVQSSMGVLLTSLHALWEGAWQCTRTATGVCGGLVKIWRCGDVSKLGRADG